MATKTLLGFGFLLTCCLMEVSSRPNSESMKIELPLDEPQGETPDKVERSITFSANAVSNNENIKGIIEKIQAINDGLEIAQKKPVYYNKAPPIPEKYVIDQELLAKIQQVIASGKIKSTEETNQLENLLASNRKLNEVVEENKQQYSRALQILPNVINQQSTRPMSFPYVINMPVLVTPSSYMSYDNNDLNSIQTKQEQPSPFPFLPSFPSFPTNFQWPFQFQWPFADFFPLIVKDPFIALQQGGGWNNFFENGQSADVCARKQRSPKELPYEGYQKDIEVVEQGVKKIDALRDLLSSDTYGTKQVNKDSMGSIKQEETDQLPNEQIDKERKDLLIESLDLLKELISSYIKPINKVPIDQVSNMDMTQAPALEILAEKNNTPTQVTGTTRKQRSINQPAYKKYEMYVKEMEETLKKLDALKEKYEAEQEKKDSVNPSISSNENTVTNSAPTQATDTTVKESSTKELKELMLDLLKNKNVFSSLVSAIKRENKDSIDPVSDMSTRQTRALKKRTIANSTPAQVIDSPRKSEKIYVAKPLVTRKPPKKIYIEAEELQDTKTAAADADLRFPFGGFDWFGNKKPVAPSPGFFINRLRVRKGGVAIAGPGGVATAGKGGTAIVGPGGLAYTQPGGLAVAGPAARVIALSSETDLNSVVTRLRELNDTSLPLKQPIREGKLVATGPVIYYHPNEQT